MVDIKDIDSSMGNVLDFQVILMDMMGALLVSRNEASA